MNYIYTAFGAVLNFIYELVNNYGLAIILFTVIIKVVLLPLTLKQQKSMIKMQRVQPKLQEIQEKYKNDKERAGQETMKLYQDYGVNPMGGCLPLLIQFPLLIAIYRVIQKPVQYMMNWSTDKIDKYGEKLLGLSNASRNYQIELAQKLENGLDFDFLGLNLAEKPWDNMMEAISSLGDKITAGAVVALVGALIIPALSCVTTFLSSKISTMMNKDKNEKKEKKEKKPERILSPDQKKNQSDNPGESMSKTMTWMMPIMTLWLTFTFPAALGLYWTVSNILSLGQTVVLNGYYSKKMERELELQEEARQKKIEERMKKYNLKKKKRG